MRAIVVGTSTAGAAGLRCAARGRGVRRRRTAVRKGRLIECSRYRIVPGSPGHISLPGAMIREPSEGKEKIGEAVQVDDEELRDLFLPREPHHRALRAAADRPRQV